jgi:hypothetical protein
MLHNRALSFAPFHPDSKLDRGLRVEPTAPRRGAPRIGRRFSAGTQTKRDPPSRRAGVKRRKLLFTTKTAKLGQAGYSDHLQPRRLTPALRDGADLESSVTGAEAPYLLGVRKRAKRPRTRSRSLNCDADSPKAKECTLVPEPNALAIRVRVYMMRFRASLEFGHFLAPKA